MTNPSPGILLYCRPGFEKECAAEVSEAAGGAGVYGFARTKPDSGYVLYQPHEPAGWKALRQTLRFDELIFARQLVFGAQLVGDLPVTDRIPPLIAAAQTLGEAFTECWLETADTNEAKELSGFLRKFAKPLQAELGRRGLLHPEAVKRPRLHLFFMSSASAYVGVSDARNASPWPMGILRLRMPGAAPSRSTLKLAEAFLVLLTDAEREKQLQPGMTAVDLGASPGGWTWQLVARSIQVTAVDNGPMAPALLDSGLVRHVREDGFRFRPKKPVDWLVCDMVEQPSRIAALAADWLAEGHCRQAMFNLKLPMKKRLEETARCRDIIDERLAAAGLAGRLRIKHLYHDREEVTAYLCAARG